jgi:hypothetical protein
MKSGVSIKAESKLRITDDFGFSRWKLNLASDRVHYFLEIRYFSAGYASAFAEFSQL